MKLYSKSTDCGLEFLPDCLLIEILGYLPLRKALETRLLSRRWRHLCTQIPILDLNAILAYNHSHPSRVHRIDRFLSLHNGEAIRSLSFSNNLQLWNATKIDSWMEFAVERKVKELHLSLDWPLDGPLHGPKPYRLPSSLVHSTSLTVLHLLGCIDIGICYAFRLPSLKKLVIGLMHMNNAMISNLLTGCPRLDTLELSCYSFDGHLKILDSRKQLRSLLLTLHSHDASDQVEIDAPRIETLVVNECLPRNAIRVTVESSLTTVKLDFEWMATSGMDGPHAHELLVQLLRQVSHAEDVSLCSWCVQSLDRWGGKSLSNSLFAASKLRLGASMLSTRGLYRLLEIFKKIEYLDLYLTDFDYFEERGDDWRLQELPESSVLQHLKILNFSGDLDENDIMEGCKFLKGQGDDRIEMVKFFFKNAKVLERVNINIDCCWEGTCDTADKQQLISCLYEMLDGFNGASPNVTINIH